MSKCIFRFSLELQQLSCLHITQRLCIHSQFLSTWERESCQSVNGKTSNCYYLYRKITQIFSLLVTWKSNMNTPLAILCLYFWVNYFLKCHSYFIYWWLHLEACLLEFIQHQGFSFKNFKGPILTIQAHGLKCTPQVHSGRVWIHFC